MRFMIYGINGYTGRLAARRAIELGLCPIAAGPRSRSRCGRGCAVRTGLPWSSISPTKGPRFRPCAGSMPSSNAAGPYSATAVEMVDACLEAGTHYVDVTAENRVFADLQARDAEAKARGVMLLPGMGAGGAPTDGLAAWLKQKLPGATSLEFFGGSPRSSFRRGTAKSAMEAVAHPVEVRRRGELEALSAPLRVRVRLGRGMGRQRNRAPLRRAGHALVDGDPEHHDLRRRVGSGKADERGACLGETDSGDPDWATRDQMAARPGR